MRNKTFKVYLVQYDDGMEMTFPSSFTEREILAHCARKKAKLIGTEFVVRAVPDERDLVVQLLSDFEPNITEDLIAEVTKRLNNPSELRRYLIYLNDMLPEQS